MYKFFGFILSMAAQRCKNCWHVRTSHSRNGCGDCSCPVTYMDKNMFEYVTYMDKNMFE